MRLPGTYCHLVATCIHWTMIHPPEPSTRPLLHRQTRSALLWSRDELTLLVWARANKVLRPLSLGNRKSFDLMDEMPLLLLDHGFCISVWAAVPGAVAMVNGKKVTGRKVTVKMSQFWVGEKVTGKKVTIKKLTILDRKKSKFWSWKKVVSLAGKCFKSLIQWQYLTFA